MKLTDRVLREKAVITKEKQEQIELIRKEFEIKRKGCYSERRIFCCYSGGGNALYTSIKRSIYISRDHCGTGASEGINRGLVLAAQETKALISSMNQKYALDTISLSMSEWTERRKQRESSKTNTLQSSHDSFRGSDERPRMDFNATDLVCMLLRNVDLVQGPNNHQGSESSHLRIALKSLAVNIMRRFRNHQVVGSQLRMMMAIPMFFYFPPSASFNFFVKIVFDKLSIFRSHSLSTKIEIAILLYAVDLGLRSMSGNGGRMVNEQALEHFDFSAMKLKSCGGICKIVQSLTVWDVSL